MSFLKRLLETVMPLPVQAAGKAASAAREGVNAVGGGLEPQSMPGLAMGGKVQPAQQGINVAGGGLSLESMPGLSFYGQGSLKNRIPLGRGLGGMQQQGQHAFNQNAILPDDIDALSAEHIQGGIGSYNPGANPLQNNRLRYSQKPQSADYIY